MVKILLQGIKPCLICYFEIKVRKINMDRVEYKCFPWWFAIGPFTMDNYRVAPRSYILLWEASISRGKIFFSLTYGSFILDLWIVYIRIFSLNIWIVYIYGSFILGDVTFFSLTPGLFILGDVRFFSLTHGSFILGDVPLTKWIAFSFILY